MAPAVPFLPSLAMFMNIYLMLKLPALTWARLGIWICIGEGIFIHASPPIKMLCVILINQHCALLTAIKIHSIEV